MKNEEKLKKKEEYRKRKRKKKKGKKKQISKMEKGKPNENIATKNK
jgi:hypothetical protein